ncbi:uncharacterized protein LOC143010295 isoform X2 [Genypterus blacodes]|uniref:uncharacterized protein LOC143010295 isoform X2 n=1 Tax=Genypterus blacodes TaxID=154954 RepID=UPI003F75BD04
MKGDATKRDATSANQGVEGKGGQSVAAENQFGERRKSIENLQKMLRRVSQSPFHSQYKTLVSSTSDSSGSSANEPQSKQNGAQESSALSPQNGASARRNLFYSHDIESSSKSPYTEDKWGRTSAELNVATIFAAPPQFQSSPLDPKPEIQTSQNRAELSQPQKDFFQTSNHSFQASELSQNTPTHGFHFHSVTLNTPDAFKDPFETSKTSNSNLFKDKDKDLFHATNEKRNQVKEDRSSTNLLYQFKSPNEDTSQSQSRHSMEEHELLSVTNKEVTLFQAVPAENRVNVSESDLFQRSVTKEKVALEDDLDIFSPLSSKPVDPFPSLSDSFPNHQGVDDIFGPTASKQFDPFQDVSNGTPDIFQAFHSNGNDIFETPSNKATAPPPHSLKSTPGMLPSSAAGTSTDLFTTKPVESPPAAASNEHSHAFLLTTPQGTQHRILQPTPFSLAGVQASPPSPSPDEDSAVQHFKRPPKPLPRIRTGRRVKPPRPPNPVKTESEPSEPVTPPVLPPKPLPKPVARKKNKDLAKVEAEDFVVLDDILLTGQERCVEDWPEDSPQLSADFKPSGKLRLRRESLMVDSDGGPEKGQDKAMIKKKDRKFSFSTLSRSSKDLDDLKEERSKTLPMLRTPSQDYYPETGENEDEDQYGMDVKAKKPLKAKVTNMLRRASTSASETKRTEGHLPRRSKEDDIHEEGAGARRWHEGATSGSISSCEDATHEDTDSLGKKKKKTLKVKFVPHRGFAITVAKRDKDPRKHGQATHKGSKEKALDEELDTNEYLPRKKLQDDAFEDEEAHTGYTLQSYTKAAPVNDEPSHGARKTSAGLTGDEGSCGMDDCKPKKPTKLKLQHVGRRTSKDDMFDDAGWKKSSCSAEELDDEEQNEMDHCMPKKPPKLNGLKTHEAQDKLAHKAYEDPPGATSSDYYMSEAAQAEWLAAQKDELAAAVMLEEEEEGDTDSLMEWWNTVEQWDEVPSDDEEKDLKEDESKSFTILADKVQCGLRVFNKIFTERAEVLWHSVITLHAIADDISTFHHKAKIAGITGGTTTAVGGVTAIAGLALAPLTFGTSLLLTVVGVGMATAGGITSASAAISDNVNNMHDRKKVEVVLQEYEGHLLDIAKVLHFVNHGVYKLRGHPFLRSGTQHYSEDWEVRRAVQMISMVDSPVMRAKDIVDDAVASVQGLFKGMDKFFIKDSRELKKGCKKQVVFQIKEVASVLNDSIVELNAVREELQDAIGTF